MNSMNSSYASSKHFSYITLSFFARHSRDRFISSLFCFLVAGASSIHIIKRVICSSFGKPWYNPRFLSFCFFFVLVVAWFICFLVPSWSSNPFSQHHLPRRRCSCQFNCITGPARWLRQKKFWTNHSMPTGLAFLSSHHWNNYHEITQTPRWTIVYVMKIGRASLRKR